MTHQFQHKCCSNSSNKAQKHYNWQIVWIRGNFIAFSQIKGVDVLGLRCFYIKCYPNIWTDLICMFVCVEYGLYDKTTSYVEMIWKFHKFIRFYSCINPCLKAWKIDCSKRGQSSCECKWEYIILHRNHKWYFDCFQFKWHVI